MLRDGVRVQGRVVNADVQRSRGGQIDVVESATGSNNQAQSRSLGDHRPRDAKWTSHDNDVCLSEKFIIVMPGTIEHSISCSEFLHGLGRQVGQYQNVDRAHYTTTVSCPSLPGDSNQQPAPGFY